MSHTGKFIAAVMIAVASNAVSERFFEGIAYLAKEDLAEFRTGLPWHAVFEVSLEVLLVLLCLALKTRFYRRWPLAWLTILGLFAGEYLSKAILHWHTSVLEVGVLLVSIGSLAWLYFAVGQLKPDVWDRQRLDPQRIPSPGPRPGLILFLSFLTGDRFRGPATHVPDPQVRGKNLETEGWVNYKTDIAGIVAKIKKCQNYDIKNEDLLEPFGVLNIRMPLEAIRYQLHLSYLTDVVLIPSIDTPRRDRETGKLMPVIPYSGSHGQTEFFSTVAKDLFDPLVSISRRIVAVDGADFEDETQISRAIADARKILAKNGASLHNIDVTGGQAICSVVGAVKCLGENDRFTYVSTRDYESRSYDFVVETPPEL